MNLQSPVLSFVVLASVASAQGPSLVTASPVGVFARTGPRAEVDAIAPHVVITAAHRINATTEAALASLGVGPGAGADSFVLNTVGSASATALVRGEAGTTASPANTIPAQGPVALLLSYRGVPRRVHVALSGNSVGGGSASLAIDVGDDATLEFRQAVDGARHTFDFVLGGTGATVARVIVDGHAALAANSTRGAYQLDLDLSMEAAGEQPCQFTSYGQGCEGMSLGGVDRIIGTTHAIELNVRGAFPNMPVVLMFGERPLDLRIPGYQCNLLVNPLVSLPIQADGNGSLDNTFFVGAGIEGLVFIQAAALRRNGNALELRTSNGARMECGR